MVRTLKLCSVTATSPPPAPRAPTFQPQLNVLTLLSVVVKINPTEKLTVIFSTINHIRNIMQKRTLLILCHMYQVFQYRRIVSQR